MGWRSDNLMNSFNVFNIFQIARLIPNVYIYYTLRKLTQRRLNSDYEEMKRGHISCPRLCTLCIRLNESWVTVELHKRSP